MLIITRPFLGAGFFIFITGSKIPIQAGSTGPENIGGETARKTRLEQQTIRRKSLLFEVSLYK
ncbi:hypothetical protein [Bacillus sp. J33]|uniref:hypothetical protein n=1 Tax=Bacillus sp. J33 TaxID=935836 RepID=UPI00047CE3D3|nr:hypothetical protein [Bacillus sp. J33]